MQYKSVNTKYQYRNTNETRQSEMGPVSFYWSNDPTVHPKLEMSKYYPATTADSKNMQLILYNRTTMALVTIRTYQRFAQFSIIPQETIKCFNTSLIF